MLTEENKKDIINAFINVFIRIRDVDYQKRIWVRCEGPECDDFDETACDFFGDCDAILEHYQDFGITEHQYRLLKKFRDVFDTFCDDNDYPEEFIDTLEWDNITKLAQEVLIAFNYQKDSQSFS
ncbi:MAG: hypothetical protein WCG10_04465 [Chlamydiota bacterium]